MHMSHCVLHLTNQPSKGTKLCDFKTNKRQLTTDNSPESRYTCKTYKFQWPTGSVETEKLALVADNYFKL